MRTADDVRAIRDFLSRNGGEGVRVISKVENADAVRNIEEIIEVSDAVMVARGDLGVEVPAWRIPHIQKKIIRMCNRESKPVITATQMLRLDHSQPAADARRGRRCRQRYLRRVRLRHALRRDGGGCASG